MYMYFPLCLYDKIVGNISGPVTNAGNHGHVPECLLYESWECDSASCLFYLPNSLTTSLATCTTVIQTSKCVPSSAGRGWNPADPTFFTTSQSNTPMTTTKFFPFTDCAKPFSNLHISHFMFASSLSRTPYVETPSQRALHYLSFCGHLQGCTPYTSACGNGAF
jgi:hypothetical protein